jgi:alkylation response protein AidB-like acyl-CoA dehydrogenase
VTSDQWKNAPRGLRSAGNERRHRYDQVTGLAVESIATCGSEEQKARWLSDMARMDKLGAFALIGPDHGSDSVAVATPNARRNLGEYAYISSWPATGLSAVA